ncbi:helix-turn-helix transcriptional regulator [Iamia sp. SCSIO 61187]|uniref:helix-turn-helix domain-containing protein n=1 Tax=Iamia sp. SCSIO 61187 TaxID=2722752 RepID=UPI001C637BD7|nr:helix-turn-helix transcriptional regulator [Iamia sp. SCSIO 61187]QYG90994.1 helix-turn-helix transcriptional regulator [Iamia sp. SCSIO 61187]
MGRAGDGGRPALAAAIRAARGREGQRACAARVGVGHSTFARWETGETVPDRETTILLDAALGQRGALVSLRGHDDWDPSGPGATEHSHAFSDEWVGPVWVRVVPATDTVDHVLLWRWGIWERRVEVDLDADGVVLLTERNQAVGFGGLPAARLTADHPVHAHWGIGPPVGLPHVMDVQAGWYPAESEALLRVAGSILTDALVWCGRTPGELATFLGVEERAVLAFLQGIPLSALLDGDQDDGSAPGVAGADDPG